MRREIGFDMDGTIADLYGQDDGLIGVLNEEPWPFMEAAPMPDLDIDFINEALDELQRKGWLVGVISWLPPGVSDKYVNEVREAKTDGIEDWFPSIRPENVQVVKYGSDKYKHTDNQFGDGILFDDEVGNRNDWRGEAFEPDEIEAVLTKLIDMENGAFKEEVK